MTEQIERERSNHRGNHRRGRGRGRGGRGGSRNHNNSKRDGNFKKPEQVKTIEVEVKPVKICVECKIESPKYRCPACLSNYCKVECYKIHKTTCVPRKRKPAKKPGLKEIDSVISQDKVEGHRLERLNTDLIKRHLYNPHLRPMLEEIVSERSSTDIRFLLDQAMQEPIFAEFARDAVGTMFPEEIEKQNEQPELEFLKKISE
ncbi:Oidioi.mRNA.OKI2018_I69.chr2.g7448.t1.cds [Oikopleura dioica]|uniref:Oidioi.mRNA.OKI2018_I69.chr2.g7448.t1.cds n=1 Tax=Oikopleura dioica TaxID=34765 RepID=A0ABN7TAW8_OIKDI|nr:Oidioi.mRNA.OKI2018_I69.chr2.g7448.t1.cds [Oikopleura dioica]